MFMVYGTVYCSTKKGQNEASSASRLDIVFLLHSNFKNVFSYNFVGAIIIQLKFLTLLWIALDLDNNK